MERKKFITTAFGASAIIAAAGATLAATPAPNATGNGTLNNPCLPSHGGFGGGPRPAESPNPTALLEHADRNLGRLIEMLQRDPNDYAGHKTQAIGYLQQALTQLQAALQSASGGAQSPIQSSP